MSVMLVDFILSVTLTDNRTGIEKKRGEENLKNGAVLRGAFPYNTITQKPPSSTREEAPMPQLKRRGCAKIREQAHKYHTWKECLCTLLPERKAPPQFERNIPLQL